RAGRALSLLVGCGATLAVQARAWRERVADLAAREADRAAHEAWTTASVAAALREARERADEAWGVADFPERLQRATDAAVAAVGRADDYAAGGAPTGTTPRRLGAHPPGVAAPARRTR